MQMTALAGSKEKAPRDRHRTARDGEEAMFDMRRREFITLVAVP